MEFISNFKIENKSHLILFFFKISIIIFMSISLLANFDPFYLGSDSYLYGISAMDLAEGKWGFTNEFLSDTESRDFVPVKWVKTIHNTAVPIGAPGIYAISSIFYFIGGYYGLFYLGPIFTIALLISSERIATNLFGRYVGLGVLILLASNATIFFFGQRLLIDNIFALFLILGCFFLAKFFRHKKENLILISSTFFVLCFVMKLSGLVFLPFEVLITSVYFLIPTITKIKKEHILNRDFSILLHFFQKLNNRKFLKSCFFLFLPWMIIFIFVFSYNLYYFGDPFTDYIKEIPDRAAGFESERLSIFQFDSNRFEWIKFYAVPATPDIVLPHSLKSNLLTGIHERASDSPTENWVGFLSISIVIIAVTSSLYYKNKRSEILIFAFVIITLWLFHSSSFLNIGTYEESSKWLSTRDRYMIPVIPLSFVLIGFIILQLWLNIKKFFKNLPKNLFISVKSIFLVGVIVISIFSLNESLPIQNIKNLDFIFNDPDYSIDVHQENWLDEKLSKNTIIVSTVGTVTVDNDAIPFYPIWEYYPLNRLNVWNPDLLPQEPIQRLKNLLSEQTINETSIGATGLSYNILIPKFQLDFETKYFRYLEINHGIILKDYSDRYCKMELKNTNQENVRSDKICYRY